QPKSEPEDWVDVARSLVAMGKLLWEMGRPTEALEVLAEVRTLAEGPARAEAPNHALRGILATSNYWSGVVCSATGKLDEALKAYQEVQLIRRELLASDRDAIDSQRELSWCDNDLGRIFQDTGRLDKALAAFEQSRRIKQAVADAHPDITEYQRDLAIAFINL